MIGQTVLRERINGQIERKKFPRFSILIGEKGSGKKTLAKEIAKNLGISAVMTETTVDNIRQVIDDCYKIIEPLVFILPDCDNMSSAAANALLKVTEEPPQRAYFILTCESIDNLLPTLKSRGVTYMLEPYSYEDKCDYLDNLEMSDEDMEFILGVSSTIGDVKTMSEMNITEFKDYVELVIDNIAEVSVSNAFKIGDKIALKDEEDKYNLKLFWKAFNAVCVDRMKQSDYPVMYSNAIAITGDFAQQLHIRGINKQMLFDGWLLKIREAWV
jgi:DNA polymerase-3 subunit delta'